MAVDSVTEIAAVASFWRTAGVEQAAAVETLRTLVTSVVMYSTTYGGYPHALSDMGPASGSTNATSAAADLIDSVLASGVKSGYKFTYTVGSIPRATCSATPSRLLQ